MAKNMVLDKFLEEFNHRIEGDKNYAHIMIEIPSSSKTFEEAKKIIEDFGVQIIELSFLSPNWILLKLNVGDMRNIALKLTEQGFFIKGINALPFKI